jgi:hypothetical protein
MGVNPWAQMGAIRPNLHAQVWPKWSYAAGLLTNELVRNFHRQFIDYFWDI